MGVELMYAERRDEELEEVMAETRPGLCPSLHALLVPGPGLGHFNAALLLAKALLQAGFTVVTIACFATPYAANASKIEPQMKALGTARIRLEVISDGVDPSSSKGYGALFAYTPHMKESLSCLLRSFVSFDNDVRQLPAVACLISDAFMAWTQDVADPLGIPRIEHFTASATSYIVLLAARSFVSNGHVPFSKTPTKWRSDPPVYIDWVPGLPGFPLDDLPQNFAHLTDVNSDPFLKKCFEASERVLKADRVLIHSALELESEAFDALATEYGVHAYATGPLVHYNFCDVSHANGKNINYVNGNPDYQNACNGGLMGSGNGHISNGSLKNGSCNGNLKQKDTLNNSSNGYSELQDYRSNGELNGNMQQCKSYRSNGECETKQAKEVDCLAWLDKQAAESVIYISYGSNVILSTAEVHELALGIEASEQSYLWVLRPDQCESGQGLPAGFKERTQMRGMIVPWAPQVAVLGHPAVGGFLSHCGWNSVLESLWEGIPMLGCPRAAEQRLNMRFVARDWGVGVEMERTEDGGVDRKFVTEGVKLLMASDVGRQVRRKARLLGRQLVQTYSIVPPALLDLARDMRARLHSPKA